MQNFNPEEVHPKIAARVEEILQQREFSKVRLHSAGAAAMYVWVREEHYKSQFIKTPINILPHDFPE